MNDSNSKTFSLRLPNDLRLKLEERAKNEGRSLANLIIYILKEAVYNESVPNLHDFK